MDVPVVDVRVVAAEHVDHHRGRGGHGRGAERQVEHGPQVLLELGGARPVDGPVAGVVRAHRELVDQQPVPGLEQLHRQQAGHAEFGGDQQRQLLGRGPAAGVQAGRGRDHLTADAVPLDRLHHRVHRALPVRGAGRDHGQLALEDDVLLGHQRRCRGSGPPVASAADSQTQTPLPS